MTKLADLTADEREVLDAVVSLVVTYDEYDTGDGNIDASDYIDAIYPDLERLRALVTRADMLYEQYGARKGAPAMTGKPACETCDAYSLSDAMGYRARCMIYGTPTDVCEYQHMRRCPTCGVLVYKDTIGDTRAGCHINTLKVGCEG